MNDASPADDQRAAYIALATVPGMGPVRLRTLLEACDTPLGALTAPFAFLRTVTRFSPAFATAIKATSVADGHRILADTTKRNAHILLPEDDDYPKSLTTIPEPPTLLYARGDVTLLTRPTLAIVGSRNHSTYGAEVCARFATEFAQAGGVVVSGMARGLDAVAHRAALDVEGGTIGVLGNGLGVVYPAANRALYEEVGKKGLLLTEFPPGERPNAGSFPRRNRVISGISRVVAVIEAAEGSGALITVDAALNQSREVLAVPGPITSPTSIGTNRLIRDGATPLLESIDLFTHYPELEPSSLRKPAVTSELRPLPDTLSERERAVALLLSERPIHIDALAIQAARPVHEILATLGALEIAGIIHQQPGRYFRRR